MSGGGEDGRTVQGYYIGIPPVLDPKGPSEELTDMQLSTVHLGRQSGDIVTC